MTEEYEFSQQYMDNIFYDFKRFTESVRQHIKTLEGKTDNLMYRLETVETQCDELLRLVDMYRKENEALKAYIKSGDKIIEIEKDF